MADVQEKVAVVCFLFGVFWDALGLNCGTWDLSLKHAGFSLVVAGSLQSARAQ